MGTLAWADPHVGAHLAPVARHNPGSKMTLRRRCSTCTDSFGSPALVRNDSTRPLFSTRGDGSGTLLGLRIRRSQAQNPGGHASNPRGLQAPNPTTIDLEDKVRLS